MAIWQWRKSFGRGPFRISLSKKGVGYSVGVPGFRLGRSATGKTYVSQSIPGTGLRKTSYLAKNQTALSAGGTLPTSPTVGSPMSLPSPVTRGLKSSMVSMLTWLNTRRRSGSALKSPPAMLPVPPSPPLAPGSAPLMSTRGAPPASPDPVFPAPTASTTPWWKQG